jgi:hypothetical protein
MPARCPLCEKSGRPRAMPCEHGDPPAPEVVALTRIVSDRLARAWLSLGAGTLALVMSSGLLMMFQWTAVMLGVVAGSVSLALSGLHTIAKPHHNLLATAARNALPEARIVP